jgi:hypothetical protein
MSEMLQKSGSGPMMMPDQMGPHHMMPHHPHRGAPPNQKAHSNISMNG